MSTLTLRGNVSGTGTFIVESPNSNTSRTISLPDVTGTLATTTDSITQTQLAAALSASGTAPIYASRAWVNFNGTGTVAIRGSGNVSSITDRGVGEYTANFTTAMPDANYSAVVASRRQDTNSSGYGTLSFGGGLPTTTGVAVASVAENGILIDSDIICVSVFR